MTFSTYRNRQASHWIPRKSRSILRVSRPNVRGDPFGTLPVRRRTSFAKTRLSAHTQKNYCFGTSSASRLPSAHFCKKQETKNSFHHDDNEKHGGAKEKRPKRPTAAIVRFGRQRACLCTGSARQITANLVHNVAS